MSEHEIAELVAELAAGESGDRGLRWAGSGTPSVATRAGVAAAGLGVVLVAALALLWVAGLLL